jgi:hypothetical protein
MPMTFRIEISEALCKRPVGVFVAFVPHAMERIAPERASELLEVGELTLSVSDNLTVQARAWPADKIIEVSGHFVEALWCATFAYWSFRRVLEEQMAVPKDSRQGRAFELTSKDPRVTVAIRALGEAVNAAVEARPVDWTVVGVVPALPPGDGCVGTFEQSATEMTLAAVGFVLQHELAHVRRGHQDTGDDSWTLEQEKDADGEAIEIILGRVHQYSATVECRQRCVAKRAWAITIATGFLNEIRRGRAKRRGFELGIGSHPQPFERLDRAVQHCRVQEDPFIRDTLVSLACAILVPHLRLAGVPLPSACADHLELYRACLDALADLTAVAVDY